MTHHLLTCYNEKTDSLVLEVKVDPDLSGAAEAIAEVSENDPEALGIYPLTLAQADQILRLCREGHTLRLPRNDHYFYLEPDE
jgi:hypothetical protein